MNATQTSTLDHLELSSPRTHPRIAELLAGKIMPSPGETHPLATAPAFTTALPVASDTPLSNFARTAKLTPLPPPTTLLEVVSSAMSELPVAMPAPVIKAASKKPAFAQPAPLPQETPTEAKPPVFNQPIEFKPVQTKPVESKPAQPKPAEKKPVQQKPVQQKPAQPKPAEQKPVQPKLVEPKPTSSPFEKGNQAASKTAQKTEQAPASPPYYQGTLPGFENFERTTDTQLAEALLPIVESSLEKALYAPKTGLHMYLEPMLRATVRRAIAEQMQTIHHFGQINALDRIAWRFKALFTSRTYDDIVFERTHRYRVEEVYLLRYQSNELISYASHDPSRHSTPRKIKYDLSRLVEELKDEDGELRKSFDLPNHNTAVVRCGQNCFLLASIRGPINALVRADLDYVLSQIEQRFGERLRDQGEQFIHVLQPLLEGCLLIQSPPPPR